MGSNEENELIMPVIRAIVMTLTRETVETEDTVSPQYFAPSAEDNEL